MHSGGKKASQHSNMKSLLMISLIVLFLSSFSHSYDDENFIRNYIRPRLFKRPGADYSQDLEEIEEKHSPVYVGNQDGLKAADKITALPGQPSGVDFDQYSGYVTVDSNAGRALFYYFTESSNPSTKPLVLWLNGGPGCSSFAGGAMIELGPLRVNSDNKTLWLNRYSWNKVANVLFLESPAGVGFSYSNTSSDYTTGDRKTAFDAYTFLVNWLERFPEYKTRDFYITGESYAGHYVPQLAYLILNKNKNTNQTVINLKGIAVGNPYFDDETQSWGSIDYMWSHALISDEIYRKVIANCNFSSLDNPDACFKYYTQADDMIGRINTYNIYYPLCSIPSKTPKSEFDPCSGDYTSSYVNTPEVQRALHANVSGKISGPWSDCNGKVDYRQTVYSVLDVIQKLTTSGIRVWLYSGDVDVVVPVTTTRYAIEKKLKLLVKTPWYPWYYQKEVGGYAVEYQNLTFVTVRGAGHFVPSYQPGRALAFFTSFLHGELPPSK